MVTDCTGPWGSLLILAAKPHQEDCTDICNFIWRLCVSYRLLNSITRDFEFTILRCDDSIEDLRNYCGNIFIISPDTRSGYHLIRVRKCDQERLVFFTLSGINKTYTVMFSDLITP